MSFPVPAKKLIRPEKLCKITEIIFLVNNSPTYQPSFGLTRGIKFGTLLQKGAGNSGWGSVNPMLNALTPNMNKKIFLKLKSDTKVNIE